MRGAWALTARGADLERLGGWYADRGVGGVVLTGPAGVGKTRLGEEAIRAAAGRPTARAVGHAATRSIPLGALAHLLPADVATGVGAGDDGRAALFHRARSTFTERAGDDRVLLLVDDVDELDDMSLALLLPLTVERTVFLIATIRSGRVAPPVVASLVKDGHLLEHELSPLTTAEVATLLHRVLDGPIESAAVDRLARVSQGNLQVLHEVVRRASDEGSLRQVGGVWLLDDLSIPGPLETLVSSHLAEAPAEGRDVLDVLAVAGAVGLTDLEAGAPTSLLETLEAGGFVKVSVDGRRTTVTLAHPLYGEVIRAGMSVLRERRLQRQLADRLEAHGARRREDLTRVARWRLEAGGDVDADVLLGAGRVAVIARDASLAVRFAQAAAARGARHDAARIEVEAAALEADVEGIERVVARVWDDATLPDAHRAHLSRRLTSARFARGDLVGALMSIERAAHVVRDPSAAASVDAQRALLLATSGKPHAALAVLDQVGDVGDPSVRAELADARSIASSSVGRFADALAAARLGARAQQELPAWLARRGMAAHVVNEAHAHAYGGWFGEARSVAQAALDRALSSGALPAQVWLRLVLGEIERDSGYGRAALQHFTAAADVAPRGGQQAALVWAEVGVAQGHLLLGEVAAARAALDRADAAGDSPVATSWATRERTRAWLLAGQGDLVAARRLLAEVADRVQDDGIWIFEAAVRHDLVRFGDPSAAVDRLVELSGIVEGPMLQATAAHARAAAADDVALYAEAVDRFEEIDAVAAAAEAAAELGELHRRRGNPRAASAADQRAARLVERSGVRTPPLVRGSGTEPLTQREREIALLAATGTSSKDIAARLVISTRTVDTHLARAYRKLGITRREELPAALGSA